jgi:single-strand DNA-binding protein
MISGRLTRDPENRMTSKGHNMCSFDVAVNRRYMDNASGEWKEEVSFVPVTAFSPVADRIKDRLGKGIPVLVEGRINMNEFTDKSGQNRKILRVNASRVQILQTAEGAGGSFTKEASSPAAEEVVEDDVPF